MKGTGGWLIGTKSRVSNTARPGAPGNSNGKRGGSVSASHAGRVYRRRFVSTLLAATLLADGAPLLRHLRLPRLGHQARLFVHLDPLLARNRRDQLANRFERQIVRRLEMNATPPHVELLPRRLERRLQLFEMARTPKRAHQVERAVVLLRRDPDVVDRLLVVSVWI